MDIEPRKELSPAETPTTEWDSPAPFTDEFPGQINFSRQSFPEQQIPFQNVLRLLRNNEQVVIPTSDGEDSGWQIGFEAQTQHYQLHKVLDTALSIFVEHTYRSATEASHGQLVPENSRIWVQSKPIVTIHSLPTNNQTLMNDPFVALAAPVVRLNTSITSMHRGEAQPLETRISAGAIQGRALYGHWAAVTDRGMRESSNQDAFIKIDVNRIRFSDGSTYPGTRLFCLDGMGGYEGGLYFVDQAERVLGYEAPLGRSVDQMTSSLLNHIEAEVEESQTSIHENELPTEMGACILAVTVLRNAITIEHRGDVRALLIRNNQFVAPTPTKDHSISGYLERIGAIDEKASFQHKDRAVVIDVPSLNQGRADRSVGLPDRLRRLQQFLAFDPTGYEANISSEIISFHRWVCEHSLVGKVHFHRIPGLQEQWQNIDQRLHTLQDGNASLMELHSETRMFVDRALYGISCGIELDSRFETTPWIPIDQGDILLLFSDGGSDVLFNSEIKDEIAGMTDPAEIVAHLRTLIQRVLTEGHYPSKDPELAPIARLKRDNVVIMAYVHLLPSDFPEAITKT